MAFHQPFQVIGFHSCDREVGLRMISGQDHLRPSSNPWDWLGPGIYFWEDNPFRALDYAVNCARREQKFSGNIKNPLVIGAIIEMGNCLNLIEPKSINIIKEAYGALKINSAGTGQKMPSNKGANRSLDCAVIRQVHEANFTSGLHIEICVVNPAQIKGYFLPQPPVLRQ